jgi:hypothetical protein
MREMDISDEMTTDKGERKRKTAPTPDKLRQGQEEEEVCIRLQWSLIEC